MHATSCHVRARRARRCPARVRVARVKRGWSRARAPLAVCPLSTVDCAPLLLKAPALWPLRPRVPRIYVFRVMCGRRLHGWSRSDRAVIRVSASVPGVGPRGGARGAGAARRPRPLPRWARRRPRPRPGQARAGAARGRGARAPRGRRARRDGRHARLEGPGGRGPP
jgi:hypothetical protein